MSSVYTVENAEYRLSCAMRLKVQKWRDRDRVVAALPTYIVMEYMQGTSVFCQCWQDREKMKTDELWSYVIGFARVLV